MRAAAHRDDADAEVARHVDRLAHRAGADHEAEAVLAVERSGDRRHPPRLERRARIDQATPQPVEIDRQPAQPVGIDPAQVRAHQAAGDDRRILAGEPVRDQQAAGEGVGRVHGGIDALGLDRLRRRHQSLISCTAFARAVQAASRNARSVPVET